MKNKTTAAWLAFLGGPLGLHRFYLYGLGDWMGWLLPIPTALGLYGIQRIQELGQDDPESRGQGGGEHEGRPDPRNHARSLGGGGLCRHSVEC